MKKKSETGKALQIGIVCVGSYLVSYYIRNILSVTTPEMLGEGSFTKEFLGTLSSVYMLAYAIGQLLNGVTGDIVKPKLMITAGTVLCGLANILFPVSNLPVIQSMLFAVIGFSLSMLRGPLVKTVSENTQSNHSRIICTFLSFACFAGPLIASLISVLFDWRRTFEISGIIAVIIGILVYSIFTLFEKKGRITYTLSKNSHGFKNIFRVFTLRHFCFYFFVGALAEISAASINFWIPAYLTEMLKITENMSKAIFSVMSVIKGFTPFITLFMFNLFRKKDIKIIRISYLLAIIFFTGMLFSAYIPQLNILCLLCAQMSMGVSSSLLWSIYIPAQSESGMVSTVNGVLDFSGYLFASAANFLIAHAVGVFGWGGIIVLWVCMAAAGFAVSLAEKE